MSRTVRGGKRRAQELAAQREVSSGDAKPAGRPVAEVLDEWVTRNLDARAPSPAKERNPTLLETELDPGPAPTRTVSARTRNRRGHP